MKNKITRTLTAFCAALLLIGGVSVPAFAQTTEDTPDATDDMCGSCSPARKP